MKKLLFSLLAGVFTVLLSYAQEQTKLSGNSMENDTVFTVIEVMPEYPGGLLSLQQFLINILQYPEEARQAKVQGTVFVGFVVSSTGDVTDVTLLKGIGYGCDEEALRVVQAIPPWTPGKMKGQNVSVRYSLPIKFIQSK